MVSSNVGHKVLRHNSCLACSACQDPLVWQQVEEMQCSVVFASHVSKITSLIVRNLVHSNERRD
jgi:hypothetical protein